MKRVLSLLICLILVFTLTSCSTTNNVDATTASSLKYIGDRDIKTTFESYYIVKDLLSNVSNIDLSQQMGSVSGFELVTEENSDDSTSIDVYYRNDERIYAVYNGYGENLWKFYTTAADGTKIVVSFWDENDSRTVQIDTIDDSVKVPYTISFENVDKSYSLGAKSVTISIYPDELSYAMTIVDGSYYISSATYWDENKELHKFTADYDEESKTVNYHMDEIVISHEVPATVVGQEFILAAGLRSENLAETAILLGRHKVYKDADDNIFINAETTLVFKDEASANVALGRLKMISVNAYAFTVKQNSGGKYYTIDIGACNYGISEGFSNGRLELIDYACDEYDDYVYKAVTLDENMSITSFAPSSISYY